MSNLTIKDLPLNKEIDSDGMAAIEGGFSFPKNVAPIKLIPPPQPVTKFNGLPPLVDGLNLGDSANGYPED